VDETDERDRAMSTIATAARPRGRPPRFTDRRQDVLRTAARVFSRQGFRQSTLEDIAQALQITRPALYHYANSKDELLSECAAIAGAELNGALTEALRETTGLDQMRAFFIRYAEIVCDDFGRCFVLTDGSEMVPEMRAANRESQLRLGRAVAEMARKGMRDGSVAKADPVDISRALFGIFNGMARWYRAGAKRKPGKMAADLLATVLDGIGAKPK
jgi:TetR/AcrR family transcriptional regulator, cholesterol catabolism regulator